MGSFTDRFDLTTPFIVTTSDAHEYVVNPLDDILKNVTCACPGFSGAAPWFTLSVEIAPNSTWKYNAPPNPQRLLERFLRYEVNGQYRERRFVELRDGVELRYVPYLRTPGRLLQVDEGPPPMSCAGNRSPADKWAEAFAALPAHERNSILHTDAVARSAEPAWSSSTIRFAIAMREGFVWAALARAIPPSALLMLLRANYTERYRATGLVFGPSWPGYGMLPVEDELHSNSFPHADVAAMVFSNATEFFADADAANAQAYIWRDGQWYDSLEEYSARA